MNSGDETLLMWRALERASCTDLTERARDMAHAIRELPQLRELGTVAESLLTLAECAQCMAIAWEAGRAFEAQRSQDNSQEYLELLAQSAAHHSKPN